MKYILLMMIIHFITGKYLDDVKKIFHETNKYAYSNFKFVGQLFLDENFFFFLDWLQKQLFRMFVSPISFPENQSFFQQKYGLGDLERTIKSSMLQEKK